MKKKLLIDFNNICIRTLLVGQGPDDIPAHELDDKLRGHKHTLLNTLFANFKQFHPDEVILAVDDQRNWRKQIYPDYKANRKLVREASTFDWAKYYSYINEFTSEIKNTFPFKILQIPYCEADDVIAILSRDFTGSENIIVTSDGDYAQLLQYKQNRVWDPIRRKWFVDSDPLKSLKVKVLCGDKGDNVPDVFADTLGKKEKTAIKLIETGKLEERLLEEDFKNRYERNQKLIAFSHIPVTLQKEIIKQYSNYELPKGPVDYLRWFVKHGLRDLSTRIQQYMPHFNRLNSTKNSMTDLF